MATPLPSVESQLLDLTRQLLTAIAEREWTTYTQLCEPSLTCFEPEAVGQLVEGMEFHKFYFDLPGGSGKRNTTLASPHVRLVRAGCRRGELCPIGAKSRFGQRSRDCRL